MKSRPLESCIDGQVTFILKVSNTDRVQTHQSSSVYEETIYTEAAGIKLFECVRKCVCKCLRKFSTIFPQIFPEVLHCAVFPDIYCGKWKCEKNQCKVSKIVVGIVEMAVGRVENRAWKCGNIQRATFYSFAGCAEDQFEGHSCRHGSRQLAINSKAWLEDGWMLVLCFLYCFLLGLICGFEPSGDHMVRLFFSIYCTGSFLRRKRVRGGEARWIAFPSCSVVPGTGVYALFFVGGLVRKVSCRALALPCPHLVYRVELKSRKVFWVWSMLL